MDHNTEQTRSVSEEWFYFRGAGQRHLRPAWRRTSSSEADGMQPVTVSVPRSRTSASASLRTGSEFQDIEAHRIEVEYWPMSPIRSRFPKRGLGDARRDSIDPGPGIQDTDLRCGGQQVVAQRYDHRPTDRRGCRNVAFHQPAQIPTPNSCRFRMPFPRCSLQRGAHSGRLGRDVRTDGEGVSRLRRSTSCRDAELRI